MTRASKFGFCCICLPVADIKNWVAETNSTPFKAYKYKFLIQLKHFLKIEFPLQNLSKIQHNTTHQTTTVKNKTKEKTKAETANAFTTLQQTSLITHWFTIFGNICVYSYYLHHICYNLYDLRFYIPTKTNVSFGSSL